MEFVLPSHIIVKEGMPVPTRETLSKQSNRALYTTHNPDIVLVSIRVGYKVFYYYVSKQRAHELSGFVDDCE